MSPSLKDFLKERGIEKEEELREAVRVFSDIHNNTKLSFVGILREGRFLDNVAEGAEAIEIVERIDTYLDAYANENLVMCDNVGKYALTKKATDEYFSH